MVQQTHKPAPACCEILPSCGVLCAYVTSTGNPSPCRLWASACRRCRVCALAPPWQKCHARVCCSSTAGAPGDYVPCSDGAATQGHACAVDKVSQCSERPTPDTCSHGISKLRFRTWNAFVRAHGSATSAKQSLWGIGISAWNPITLGEQNTQETQGRNKSDMREKLLEL